MIERFILIKLLLIGTIVGLTQCKDTHKVHCSENWMLVDIALPDGSTNDTSNIYLQGMKGYPNPKCRPNVIDGFAQFRLPLEEFFECGIYLLENKITGKKVYYHKIIVVSAKAEEKVSVKCIKMTSNYQPDNHHILTRRDVLPVGFEEPIDLEITTSLTERAPEPILNVAVRQGSELVSGELNVSPGTPLSMEINLDKGSAPVYGLGVTYMQVTDTRNQEETIIFNGCSVDPYLFENFNTLEGDSLAAKFRAFKFPDSTYVQFRGTVNVCVDKCKGIQCSNGQIGYGRRRREIAQSHDPNKVYEISMTTFIKVNDVDGSHKETLAELEQKLKQLQLANQKLERNSRGSVFESVHDHKNHGNDAVHDHKNYASIFRSGSPQEAIVEETSLIRGQSTSTSGVRLTFASITTILCLFGISIIFYRKH